MSRRPEKAILESNGNSDTKMRESFSGEGEKGVLQAEVLHVQQERGLFKSERESGRESGKDVAGG